MKQGRSLADLACEIERQRHAKRDFIADTRQMRMLEDGRTLALEDVGEFPLTEHAIGQVACTNGMVREGGKRWMHLGRAASESEDVYELLSDETRKADDRALLLKMRDTIAAAFEPQRFERWLDELRSATQQKIEGDPVRAVEVLGQKFAFTESERTSVLRHLIEGGDLSRYGLINAVTRTADDLEFYDRASEFESFGGAVLSLAPSEWKEVQQAA